MMDAAVTATQRAAALADASHAGRLGGLRVARVAASVIDAVVRTVLPPVCAGCGVSGHWMCPICDTCVRRIDLGSICERCGGHREGATTCVRCADWSRSLARCRSAYIFDGAVRQSIHRLKYSGEHARAEWCGIEIARLAIELGWRPDILVPVPLHRSILRTRGYNQSAKIASFASIALSVPWGDVLVRTRPTVSQVGLDADHRRENVSGAFACRYDLTDLAIVLIDDVVTTGATLEACAETCQSAGALDVRAVTLATGS